MSRSGNFDQIEAYLTGQMSKTEQQAFEKRLLQDADLAMEYKLQKLEHQSMEVLVEQELRSSISSWSDAPPANPFEEEDRRATTPPSAKKEEAKVVSLRSNRLRQLWIAAAIAGIIVTIFGINHYLQNGRQELPVVIKGFPIPSPPEDPEDINEEPVIVEKKKPSPPVLTPKKEVPPPTKTEPDQYTLLAMATYDDPENELPKFASTLKDATVKTDSSAVIQAAEAFDQGNYKEAIEFLGPPKAEDQSHVRFLRAHTYFRLADYKNAISEFAHNANDEFVPSHEESRWYLLLSYLATYQENRKACIDLAQELASDKFSPYQKKAEKLLSTLQEQ